ncbi:MAG: hypothetical protein IPP44_08115 [Ideonella sp.]|nr:hypothetical protein [Ideonella sp.]
MRPERLSQVFEPFNRLGAESGSIEGTGIGLSICKRLVELMGGAHRGEQPAGEGSKFWSTCAATLVPRSSRGSAMPSRPRPRTHAGPRG